MLSHKGAPKNVEHDQSVIELILSSHPWLLPRAVVDFAILASAPSKEGD